jgi:hypothetical protein
MQSQATTYARLAEAPAIKNGSLVSSTEVEKTKDGLQLIVMPVSAENTGLLPNRGGNINLCCAVGMHRVAYYVIMIFTRLSYIHSFCMYYDLVFMVSLLCRSIHTYVQALKYT